jgi:hypothetical protein
MFVILSKILRQSIRFGTKQLPTWQSLVGSRKVHHHYQTLNVNNIIRIENKLMALFSKKDVLSQIFYALMRFNRKKIINQIRLSRERRKKLKSSKLKFVTSKKSNVFAEKRNLLSETSFNSIKSLKDIKILSSKMENLTEEENRDFNFQSGIYFEPNPLGIFFVFFYGLSEFFLTIGTLYYVAVSCFDFSIFQTIFSINENFLIYHYLTSVYYTPYTSFYTVCLMFILILITFWIWLEETLEAEEEEEDYSVPSTSWFIEGFLVPAFWTLSFIALISFLALSYHNIIIIYGYFLPSFYDQFKNFIFVISTFHQKITNYVIVFDKKVLADLFFLTQPKFLKVIEADPLLLFNGSRTSIYYTSLNPKTNPFFHTDKYFTNFPNFFSKNFFQITDFQKKTFYSHELLKQELLQDIRKLNYLTKLEVNLSLQKNFFPTVSNHFNTSKRVFEIEPGARTFSSTPDRLPSSLLTSLKFRNFEASNYLFYYGVPQPSHPYKFGTFGSFKFSHYKVKTTHNLLHTMKRGYRMEILESTDAPISYYAKALMKGSYTHGYWFWYKRHIQNGGLEIFRDFFYQPVLPQSEHELRNIKYKMPDWYKVGFKRDANVNDIFRPLIGFGTFLSQYYRVRKIYSSKIRALSHENAYIKYDVATIERVRDLVDASTPDLINPGEEEFTQRRPRNRWRSYFFVPRGRPVFMKWPELNMLNSYDTILYQRIVRDSAARYMKRFRNVEANFFKFDHLNLLKKKLQKKYVVVWYDIIGAAANRKPYIFPYRHSMRKPYIDRVLRDSEGGAAHLGALRQNWLMQAGHYHDTGFKRIVEATPRLATHRVIYSYKPSSHRTHRDKWHWLYSEAPRDIPVPERIMNWTKQADYSERFGYYFMKNRTDMGDYISYHWNKPRTDNRLFDELAMIRKFRAWQMSGWFFWPHWLDVLTPETYIYRLRHPFVKPSYMDNNNVMVRSYTHRDRSEIIDNKSFKRWGSYKNTKKLVNRQEHQLSAWGESRGKDASFGLAVGMKKRKAVELYYSFQKLFKFLTQEGYKYENFYFRNYSRTFRFIFVDFISKNVLNQRELYFGHLKKLKYYSNYMDEEIKISQLFDFQNVLWNKYLHKHFRRTLIARGSQVKLKDLNFPMQNRFTMPRQLILMPNPSQKIVRHAQLLYRLDWKMMKDLWLEYPRQHYRSNFRKLWHYRANEVKNLNRYNRYTLKVMIKDAQACLVFDRKQRAFNQYLNEIIFKKLNRLTQHQNFVGFGYAKTNSTQKVTFQKDIYFENNFLRNYFQNYKIIEYGENEATFTNELNIFDILNVQRKVMERLQDPPGEYCGTFLYNILPRYLRNKDLQLEFFNKLIKTNLILLTSTNFSTEKTGYLEELDDLNIPFKWNLPRFFETKNFFPKQVYDYFINDLNTHPDMFLHFAYFSPLSMYSENLYYSIVFEHKNTVDIANSIRLQLSNLRSLAEEIPNVINLLRNLSLPYCIFHDEIYTVFFLRGKTPLMLDYIISNNEERVTRWKEFGPPYTEEEIEFANKMEYKIFQIPFYFSYFFLRDMLGFSSPYSEQILPHILYLFNWISIGFLLNFQSNIENYHINSNKKPFFYAWHTHLKTYNMRTKKRYFLTNFDVRNFNIYKQYFFFDYKFTKNNFKWYFLLKDPYNVTKEFKILSSPLASNNFSKNYTASMLYSFFMSDLIGIFDLRGIINANNYFVNAMDLIHLNFDLFAFNYKVKNFAPWEGFLSIVKPPYKMKVVAEIVANEYRENEDIYKQTQAWLSTTKRYRTRPLSFKLFSTSISHYSFTNTKNFYFSKSVWLDMQDAIPYYLSQANNKFEQNNYIFDYSSRHYIAKKTVVPFITRQDCVNIKNFLMDRSFNSSNYELSNVLRRFAYRTKRPYMKSIHLYSFLKTKNRMLGKSFSPLDLNELDSSSYLELDKFLLNSDRRRRHLFSTKLRYEETIHKFGRRRKKTRGTRYWVSELRGEKNRTRAQDTFNHNRKKRSGHSKRKLRRRQKVAESFRKIIKIFKRTSWLIPLINYNDKFLRYTYKDVFIVQHKDLKQPIINIQDSEKFNRKGLTLLKILYGYDFKQYQLLANLEGKNIGEYDARRPFEPSRKTSANRLQKQRIFRLYSKSRSYRRAILLNLVHRMKFGVANIVNDRIFGKEISNDRFLLKRLFGLSLAGVQRTMFSETSTINFPFSNLTFLNLLNSRISTPNLNTKIFFEDKIFDSLRTRGRYEKNDLTLKFLHFFLLRSKEFREHFRIGYKLWMPFVFKIKYSSGLIGFGSRWVADDSWVTKRFKKYGFRSFKSFRTQTARDLFSPKFPMMRSVFIHRPSNYIIPEEYIKEGRKANSYDFGRLGRKESFKKYKRFRFFNLFADRAGYISKQFFFSPRLEPTFVKYTEPYAQIPSFQHRIQRGRSFRRHPRWKLPTLKLRPSPKYLILRNNQIRFNKLLIYLNFFKSLSVPLNKPSSLMFWDFFLSNERRFANLYSIRDRLNPQINFEKSFIEKNIGKVLIFDQVKPATLKTAYPPYAELDIFFYKRLYEIKDHSFRFLNMRKNFAYYKQHHYPLLSNSSLTTAVHVFDGFYSKDIFAPLFNSPTPPPRFRRYSSFKFLRTYLYFLTKDLIIKSQKPIFSMFNSPNINDDVYLICPSVNFRKFISFKKVEQYSFLQNYGLSSKDYFFVSSTSKLTAQNLLSTPPEDPLNYRGFFQVYLKNLNKEFPFVEAFNKEASFLTTNTDRIKERYKLLNKFLIFQKRRLDHTNFYTPEEYVDYKRQKRFAWKRIHKFRKVIKHYKRYYSDMRVNQHMLHKRTRVKDRNTFHDYIRRYYRKKMRVILKERFFKYFEAIHSFLLENKKNSKYYSSVYNSKLLRYHLKSNPEKSSFSKFMYELVNFKLSKERFREYFLEALDHSISTGKRKKNSLHLYKHSFEFTDPVLDQKEFKLLPQYHRAFEKKKHALINNNATMRDRNQYLGFLGLRVNRFYFPFRHSRWYYRNYFASYPTVHNKFLTIDHNYFNYQNIRILSYILLKRKIEFDVFTIKKNLFLDSLLYHYPIPNFDRLSIEDYERFIYLNSKTEYLKLKFYDCFLFFYFLLKKLIIINFTNTQITFNNPFEFIFYRFFQFILWVSYINTGYAKSPIYDFKGLKLLKEGLQSFVVFFQFLSIFSFTFFFVLFLYPFWIITFYITFMAKYKSGMDDAGFWSKANLKSRHIYIRDQILERRNVRVRRSYKLGRIRLDFENYFNRFFHNTYRLEKLLYTTAVYYDFANQQNRNITTKTIKRPVGFPMTPELLNDWDEEGVFLIVYATKLYLEFLFILFLTALFYILIN